MQPRTLSREEEAELARSNKKVKDINHAEFNEGTRAASPPLGNQDPVSPTRTSFKDKLVGEIPGAFAQAFDLIDEMEEGMGSDEENGEDSNSIHEGQVKVRLTKETLRRIRGPWSKAIIVKLVGKTMGLNYMQSRLPQLWRLEGRMDCIDLSYGFFLVRFYSKDDLERVIKRGPWFIGDHFLSLRPWEPFFKPSTANVSLIAVWIRLNELPIELYETEVLKEIGEAIGKVLRIDSHTATEERGRYARLCVQIDINRPLVNSILIGHFEQVVTYEGIQRLCFSCGRIGHKVDACPYTIRKEKEPQALMDEVPKSKINEAGDGNVDHRKLHDGDTHNACGAPDVEGHYGPWMIVSRKRYGQKGTRTGHGTGLGTGYAGSSAWNSTNRMTPVFAEETDMAVGGPSPSNHVPQRRDSSKSKAGFKYGEKSWVSKGPGLFILKEKPNSSPSVSCLPVDSFKQAVTSLKHGNSPDPSHILPRTYPSSVKGKKSLARKLATASSFKCAASNCVESSTPKLPNSPLTHLFLPRAEPNHGTDATFEFSAKSNSVPGGLADYGYDQSLQVNHAGETSSFSMAIDPTTGILDSNLSSNVGVQPYTQNLVSEDKSLAEDQMSSDEDSEVEEEQMVADEGSGAANSI